LRILDDLAEDSADDLKENHDKNSWSPDVSFKFHQLQQLQNPKIPNKHCDGPGMTVSAHAKKDRKPDFMQVVSVSR